MSSCPVGNENCTADNPCYPCRAEAATGALVECSCGTSTRAETGVCFNCQAEQEHERREKGIVSEQVDLSSYSDQEISDLYWALYDLNATLLKLISAGLAGEHGECDIDGTSKLLGAEIKMRRALRRSGWKGSDELVDKIGADF